MRLKPSDMICFALYSTANAMQQTYRPYLEALGLTYPQYLVMRTLWAAEAAPTVSGIAAEVHLESSTLTPLLKRLEKAGLIRRQRDAEDERRVVIHLTDTGRAMEADAAHIPGCIVEETGMTAEDLVRLKEEVQRLGARLRKGKADC